MVHNLKSMVFTFLLLFLNFYSLAEAKPYYITIDGSQGKGPDFTFPQNSMSFTLKVDNNQRGTITDSNNQIEYLSANYYYAELVGFDTSVDVSNWEATWDLSIDFIEGIKNNWSWSGAGFGAMGNESQLKASNGLSYYLSIYNDYNDTVWTDPQVGEWAGYIQFIQFDDISSIFKQINCGSNIITYVGELNPLILNPEPSTLFLLCTGLSGFLVIKRKKIRDCLHL